MNARAVFVIAAVAGTIASTAVAGPGDKRPVKVGRTPPQLRFTAEPTKVDPVAWVKVRRMPDGSVVPTSPVTPYVAPVGGTDLPTQNAFDIFQSDPTTGAPTGGIACGLAGEAYRYYGGPTYISSTIVNDFTVDPAAVGLPIDRIDFAWFWGAGALRPHWILVEIYDTFNSCTTGLPPAATFVDGIAFQFADNAGGAGYYTNIGFPPPDPAAALGAPVDGSGAYAMSLGVYNTLTQTWTPEVTPGCQPFYWGKNVVTQLGTNGPDEWDDDGGPAPAPNISNGVFAIDECYNYTGAVPCPAEGVGATMAFWTEPGTGGGCYANCDLSTGAPILTGNDFVCFINAYATNDSYANCDNSTGTPLLTGNDYVCFINAYAQGCT